MSTMTAERPRGRRQPHATTPQEEREAISRRLSILEDRLATQTRADDTSELLIAPDASRHIEAEVVAEAISRLRHLENVVRTQERDR